MPRRLVPWVTVRLRVIVVVSVRAWPGWAWLPAAVGSHHSPGSLYGVVAPVVTRLRPSCAALNHFATAQRRPPVKGSAYSSRVSLTPAHFIRSVFTLGAA